MYYNIEKKMKKIRLKGEEPYLFFFFLKRSDIPWRGSIET
jgi:hypothetical protein